MCKRTRYCQYYMDYGCGLREHGCDVRVSQIGQWFKPEHADTEYDRAKYMLTGLGLEVRDQHCIGCQLDDRIVTNAVSSAGAAHGSV